MNAPSPASSDLFIAVASARAYETQKDLKARNRIALSVFACHANRHVSHEGWTLETWWDRRSRSYITAVTNTDGHRVGDADYSGNREDAAVAHLWGCYRLFNLAPSAR